MEKKYVIVRSNRLNSFGHDLGYNNIKVVEMFREKGVIQSLIREVLLKLHCKLPKYLFNPELAALKADIVIVFDGHARKEFLVWLKEHNRDKRLIFWCWNTVEEIEKNFKLSDVPKEYEMWSYSEFDCANKDLNYNTTFFWKNYNIKSDKDYNPEYDVYFVGKDKGRMKRLLDLKYNFSRNGIRSLIQIMPNRKWEHNREYSRPIPYSKVLDNIKKSKAILDIKVSTTAGPSLRALEAAFFKKKLITDDVNVKKFKFYSDENIYILGKDNDASNIKAFLDNEFKETDLESLQYYNVKNWITRFG